MLHLSGNQRPDLLTSLMNMSLVLRLPREMHFSRSSSNVSRLPSFLKLLQKPHVLLTFDEVHNPSCLPRETTSERPKVVRDRQFLTLLTSKCASSRSDMQLLISHAARWLRTRRFREPTFLPSGAQKLWKNTVLRDFSIFSCVLTFFFDLLSSADSFSSLTSSLLTLSLL